MKNGKFYSGTKNLLGKPMTKEEYCQYRNWLAPENEDPKEMGYLVEYLDGGKPNDERHQGYISWSPKDVFEKAYNENGSLNFGQAIEALKEGKRVARQGWNGRGLFVFMQVPSEINGEIIPKMQSLPDSVKAVFSTRINDDLTIKNIKYSNQMAIVDEDNNINSWVASSSDTFATDWCILD